MYHDEVLFAAQQSRPGRFHQDEGQRQGRRLALAASSGPSVKVDYLMSGATRIAEKIEVAADHAMAPAKIKAKK